MPKSRKRKRRDGSVVAPRQTKPKPLTRLTPVEPAQADGSREGPEPITPASSRQFSTGAELRRERMEDHVLNLVNAERAKAGVPPLHKDARLRRAARGHSADMARRGFTSHDDPDGVTPVDRMRAEGYPEPGAENIARGQSHPQAVMQAWMNSPGHRANILRAEFARIGIGVHLGTDGPWWTQNFGY